MDNPFRMTLWISLLIFMPICWPWRVQIIQPQTSVPSLLHDGYKEKAEFELSLLTASIGFVDDEHLLHSTPTHNFLEKYVRLAKWHEAADTKITKTYFKGHEVRVCKAYLSDPIFEENGISLYVFSSTNKFTTESKVVKFHYSSRDTASVKVVKCPIQRLNKDTLKYEESKLYFQEIRHSELLELRRGYFVFANTKGKWQHDEPLELLMYTRCNNSPLPTREEAGEEAEFQRSKEPVTEGFTIKFTVKKHFRVQETDVRLFGEEAEIVFLTKNYGFVNHTVPLWRKRKFIQIMDRLRQGYELNDEKLGKIKKSDPATVCKNYIEHNDQLKKRNIRVKKYPVGANIAWVTKTVQFLHSKIFREGRNLKLLQCPIASTEKYLYLLPVHYRRIIKSALVFTFKEDKKNSNQVIPFILSPVNERYFEESTNIPPPNRAIEEKNFESTSNPAKIGPSNRHPLLNLIDSKNLQHQTEEEKNKGTVDTNLAAASGNAEFPDLINLSEPILDVISEPVKDERDLGGDVPPHWEKFD